MPCSSAISRASGERRFFRRNTLSCLDCAFEEAIEHTEEASRKGWIVFKRIGDIIEVLFPNLITRKEMEWLREQS